MVGSDYKVASGQINQITTIGCCKRNMIRHQWLLVKLCLCKDLWLQLQIQTFKRVSAVFNRCDCCYLFFGVKSISLPVVLVAAGLNLQFSLLWDFHITSATIPFVHQLLLVHTQLGDKQSITLFWWLQDIWEKRFAELQRAAITTALQHQFQSIIVSALRILRGYVRCWSYLKCWYGGSLFAAAEGAIVSMMVVMLYFHHFVLLDKIIIPCKYRIYR